MTARTLKDLNLDEPTRATLLSFAENSPVTVQAVMFHLNIGKLLAQSWLDELINHGLLMYSKPPKSAGLYSRPSIDEELVMEELTPDIHRALNAGPALPGTIARKIGAPLEIIQETCKALHKRSVLGATPINGTFVYCNVSLHLNQPDSAPANLVLDIPEPESRPVLAVMARVMDALSPEYARGLTQLQRQAGLGFRSGCPAREQLELACVLGLAQQQENGAYLRTERGSAWRQDQVGQARQQSR